MREAMLILHFIGLTMGLGTSFAHAFLGIAVSKMTPGEAIKFRLYSLVLSKMGNIGMGLLIFSGLYLITPYWNILQTLHLLIIKLALVIILVEYRYFGRVYFSLIFCPLLPIVLAFVRSVLLCQIGKHCFNFFGIKPFPIYKNTGDLPDVAYIV